MEPDQQMTKLNHHVLVKFETYNKLRKFLLGRDGDIRAGDICKAATEAIENYISENLPEGVEL